MGKVTSAWARPIQGVSQQPEKIRRDGQCTLQENMIPSVVDGLKKRIGTYNISKILTTLHVDSKVHYYARGDDEEYLIILEPNTSPRVFDMAGIEQVVNIETNLDYTSSDYSSLDNPRLDIITETISDYTFFVNKKTGVLKDPAITPDLAKKALVYCQFANYGRTYEIVINDVVVASYTTPNGDVPEDITDVDTSYVAARLVSNFTRANTSITQNGNVLEVTTSEIGPFEVTTIDGAGGEDLIAVQGTVDSLAKLPPKAPIGFKVQVKVAGEKDSGAYWLVATGRDGDVVKWVETTGPRVTTAFDKGTMPHTLIRESVDVNGIATFKYDRGEWEARDVGDDESNPYPSFINDTVAQTISSVGLFQNRLYFTSGEAIITTRTGEFFNFFKRTTQVSSDDDPFDVYADAKQVNELLHSVVLDGDLVFFSENAQFILKGDKPITKANATLKLTTSFKSQREAIPVAAGENIFFAFNYGQYSGIRELFTDSVIDTKRARPVTEHIESYLKGNVVQMETSSNNNWLLVRTDEDTNVLYVYNWLWLGDEKVQSAWHSWVWPDDEIIRGTIFSRDLLYILVERPEGVFLEVLNIGDPDDNDLPFPVRLDRKHTITATKVLGRWEFPDTFSDEEIEKLEYVRSVGCYPEDIGTTVIFERGNGILFTDDELSDGTSATLLGGVKYTSKYQPSEPVVKDHKDRVIGIDKLMIGRIYINYERTGHVTVKVSDDFNDVRDYEFNGRFIGDFNNVIGFAPLVDGTYAVPIMQKADRVNILLETSSHLPFQMRDMELAGQFKQRGRRV